MIKCNVYTCYHHKQFFFLPFTSGRRGREVGLILRKRNLRGFLSSKNKTEWMIFLFQFDNSERCQTNSDFLDIETCFTVEFSQGLLMPDHC